MDAVLDISPTAARRCCQALPRRPRPRGAAGGARGRRRAGEAAQDARRPAVELDLCARRHLVRGDVGRVEGAARGAGAAYSLTRPEIVTEQVSVDGTRKWLLRLPIRGHEKRAPEIETVYIPEADRGTLCISSQVGCTLTCSFCHTGTQRLVRNLEPEEIVGQILLARDRIGDWPGAAAPQDGGLVPTGGAQDHQRRADGHGRAALQFRQRARRHGHCRRRRRPRHVEAAHHAVDQRGGAGDPALGRRGRHHARHLAARGARRAARQAGADQQASIRLPS